MHCPSCGNENPDEHRFCANCGVDLRALRQAEQPSEGAGARAKRLIGGTGRERLITGATALAIVVGVIAFIALDSDSDDPALAEDDPYVLALDAQCLAAKERVARRTARALTTGADIDEYASDLSETVSVWRNDLLALTPPPDTPDAAAPLSSALLAVSGEFAALAEAGRSGTAEAISDQAAQVDAATATLEEAVADVGLADCAAIGFSFEAPATP